MSPESWLAVKQVLDRLIDLPDSERQRILEGLEDQELRSHVESFLAVDEAASDFIDEPLWQLFSETEHKPRLAGDVESSHHLRNGNQSRSQEPGDEVTRVGPYRLKRLLGRGGMGQVHLAVREDDYEQEVALKRTFGAVDREKLLDRFLRERQILANLQHPGIARLLDGGTDEFGFPYLVMDFVDGEPIDQYCDRHNLGLRQRLELFRQVCKAVHHAHQNLVVHRDLKPTNILVTNEGQPRLLDFGIAKLLEGQSFMQTAAGCAPLTPACASPEQLMDEPVTTACDVYALGVLLYRLMSGRKPYELEGLSYPGLVRKVCLSDPVPPSAAVGKPASFEDMDSTELSGARRLIEEEVSRPEERQKRRLRRQLQGDLDAIALKAMRKEPRHRYASAFDLSDDVKSYLQGLPVQARRGNWLYYSSKQLRRNRPAVLILLLMLISAISSTVLWQRAERGKAAAEAAREQAELARDEAELMSGFLTDMLQTADPDQARGAQLTMLEVVDAAHQRIESLARPNLKSTILATLSDVYDSLGMYQKGLALSEQALRMESQHSPVMSRFMAGDLMRLGRSYYNLEDYQSAERIFMEVYSARGQVDLPPDSEAILLLNLAAAKQFLSKPEQAERFYRQVLQADASPRAVASAHYGLGAFFFNQGSGEKAALHLEKALDYRIKNSGPMNKRVIEVQDSLAKTYLMLGKMEEATALLTAAYETANKFLENEHPVVGGLHKLRSRAFLLSGQLGEAEREALKAVEIFQRDPSANEWKLADANVALAACYLEKERYSEAESILLASLEILHLQLGPRHHNTKVAERLLVKLRQAMKGQ